MRAECLDWLLIVGRGHLEQVLRIYVEHYNRHRAHRALQLKAPDPAAGLTSLTSAEKAAFIDETCSVAAPRVLASCMNLFAPFAPEGAAATTARAQARP